MTISFGNGSGVQFTIGHAYRRFAYVWVEGDKLEGVTQAGGHTVIAVRTDSGGWTDNASGQEYQRVVMQ
jgi:hypothetical protein